LKSFHVCDIFSAANLDDLGVYKLAKKCQAQTEASGASFSDGINILEKLGWLDRLATKSSIRSDGKIKLFSSLLNSIG
jgi:hypothetical protein